MLEGGVIHFKTASDRMRKRLRCLLGIILYPAVSISIAAQTSSRAEIEQHYQRAQQALAAKQGAIAAQEFREILRLDPGNASAHANLGVIAYSAKNFAQASEEFRTALKLQPGLWNAQAFLGMSELRLGKGEEAKPLLDDAFRHVKDARLRSEVGMDLIAVYYQSSELDQAVDVLRGILQATPGDPATLYVAYRTYSDLAAHQLTRLAQVAPESAQMHQVLAQLSASQDDFVEAIAQYRKALEIDPEASGVHFELGQTILANSTDERARDEAENQFHLALAADPNNAECEYLLGEIAWLRSQPQEALKHYNRALALRPGLVDAHIAAGKALLRLGNSKAALQELLQAVTLDPQDAVAHYRLSQVYMSLGQTAEAERESATFRKIRDSEPHFRALGQLQRSVRQQTVDPSEPQ
jgi:predicted Zn-dependent protease